MADNEDPFDMVRNWWDDTGRKVESDTARLGIDPSTKEGAFECLILGILYSIEDTGSDIKNTLDALRENGYTRIELLSRISGDSGDLDRMYQIFKQEYFGGRLAIYTTKKGTFGGKIPQIIANAKDVLADQYLRGDIRKLYQVLDGNGYEMLQRLRRLHGIRKKAFWVMREMRMRGVWHVGGRYCCVPDKQVGSSLERWDKIQKWPEEHSPSFNLCLKCSQIVWDYFGGLYDLPVLHYAREFKCNDRRSRRCAKCEIIACKARSEAIGDSSLADN